MDFSPASSAKIHARVFPYSQSESGTDQKETVPRCPLHPGTRCHLLFVRAECLVVWFCKVPGVCFGRLFLSLPRSLLQGVKKNRLPNKQPSEPFTSSQNSSARNPQLPVPTREVCPAGRRNTQKRLTSSPKSRLPPTSGNTNSPSDGEWRVGGSNP